MGTKKGAFYLGLAACVVVAAGLFFYLGRPSSPSSTPPSGAPAATGTIGGIAWHEGASFGLRLGGVGATIIPIGDRLFALGNVGAAPSVGKLGAAVVWSSTDAVTWKLLTKPDTFSADSAYVQGATADGRGGLYMVASRYDSARANALWHSPDGSTWTRITVGQSQVLTNATIAAVNGMAVVTGQALVQQQPRRYVWYSTDGLAWTEAALPDAYPDQVVPALIAGGAGGFEIVEESGAGKAWHSDDGRTWVKAEPPGAKGAFSSFNPTKLLVSGRTFVAMGYDGGNGGVPSAWTSADGMTWSRSTIDDPGPEFGCAAGCQIAAVTKVGSALVAVGYRTLDRASLTASALIATWASMDDGRTWHVRGSGSPSVLPSVLAPIGSEVVMFGEQLPVISQFASDAELEVSARGTIAWRAVASATPQPSIRSMPSNTPSPALSLNASITFKQAKVPKASAQPWSTSTMAYLNGHFYNVFNRKHGSVLWESDDGTAWRQIANETRFNGKAKTDCAFVAAITEDGNGGLVAVGGTDGTCTGGNAAIWQSDDGVTWRRATIQPSLAGTLWYVAYAAGNLVAIGVDGQELYSADHGKTWRTGSLNGRGGLLALAAWHDGFIAGDGGHDWSSNDGRTWVALGPAPQGAVAVGGVMVGASDGLYWSPDGATWSASTGAPFQQLQHWAIGSDGRVAIAVKELDEMWITTDGKTWRNTGAKLVVTASGEHGQVPVFCVGAGRLVTIISDGKLTRAYYADLAR